MSSEICNLCKEQATHTYVWEWGETGVFCSTHQIVLQQTADNLQRRITFAPISSLATPPLQREERVRLRAEALVLGEELEEAKTRGLDLYRQNTALIAQVQSLTVREREAQAQRKDAVIAAEKAEVQLHDLQAENATLADELGRLRVLIDVGSPPQGPGGAFELPTSPGVG